MVQCAWPQLRRTGGGASRLCALAHGLLPRHTRRFITHEEGAEADDASEEAAASSSGMSSFSSAMVG